MTNQPNDRPTAINDDKLETVAGGAQDVGKTRTYSPDDPIFYAKAFTTLNKPEPIT